MLNKPYRRIIRPFTLSRECPCYEVRGSDGYLTDPVYAPDRVDAVRSYYTLERDLVRLFDYVEPTDSNARTYSHRIYELLLRASTEVEANCKAILVANGYKRARTWNIRDYRKINQSSRLSDYELRVDVWRGSPKTIRPFAEWKNQDSLSWYRAYNAAKHDRHQDFEQANLDNAVSAIAAVRAVLFSQFFTYSFRAHASFGMYELDDGWFSHEDSIFALKASHSWTRDECYDFNWERLRGSPDRFAEYPF